MACQFMNKAGQMTPEFLKEKKKKIPSKSSNTLDMLFGGFFYFKSHSYFPSGLANKYINTKFLKSE